MRKPPTIAEWADKLGVNIHIAKKYIQVRNNWLKNVSRQAKQLGIDPISARPRAFTVWAKNPFRPTEDLVIESIAKWEQRNKNFRRYTTEKAQAFLSNILLAQNSTGTPDDDRYLASAWRKLNKLSNDDYLILASQISKEIKNKDVIYRKNEDGTMELNFDFQKVYKIIKNYKPTKKDGK